MERKLLTYSKKEKWAYVLSIIGQNVFYGVFANTFAYFLQFTLLIPTMYIGVFMGFARVFDAFNDPIMGFVVDRTNSKWGKCRPYLFITPLLLLIVTIMSFMSPFGVYTRSAAPALVIAWGVMTYVLFGIAYTIDDIPRWGLPSLSTEDNGDRDKLFTSARVVAAVGMGLGYIVQPVALALSGSLKGGEQSGFLITAVIFSVVGFLMMQPAPFAMKERISPEARKTGPLHAFKEMWKNKPFRQIIISGVLGSPKMLIMLVALPLMTYYFADKSFWKVALFMGLVGAPLFVGQYIAIGLTPRLLKRISKKKLYNYSNLFAVLPSLLIFILYKLSPMGMTSPVNLGLLAVCFVFVGVGIGIPVVLMSIMIADCVDYQEYMTGERPDGVFFAGQSFIAKLQSAVATFIAGIGYTHVGFSDVAIEKVNAFIAAGGTPRTEPEFQPFMMIMFFLITIPAALGYLLTVIPMWKYALDTDEHNRIIGELNQRRHTAPIVSEETA